MWYIEHHFSVTRRIEKHPYPAVPGSICLDDDLVLFQEEGQSRLWSFGAGFNARVLCVETADCHAMLEADSSGDLTLIDMGDAAGTRINGARISKCRLAERDLIGIKGWTFRYTHSVHSDHGDHPPYATSLAINHLSPATVAGHYHPAIHGLVGVLADSMKEASETVSAPSSVVDPGESVVPVPSSTLKDPLCTPRSRRAEDACPFDTNGIGSIVYAAQLWHAIRLTKALGKATTRRAQEKARSNLRAFFHGLGMNYNDFFGTKSARST